MVTKKGQSVPLSVIDAEGDKGILTRLIVMSKPKPPPPGDEEAGANIEWVFKPMVARRGRGQTVSTPSIGSMQVPGKP